jgi:hypothetical protein
MGDDQTIITRGYGRVRRLIGAVSRHVYDILGAVAAGDELQLRYSTRELAAIEHREVYNILGLVSGAGRLRYSILGSLARIVRGSYSIIGPVARIARFIYNRTHLVDAVKWFKYAIQTLFPEDAWITDRYEDTVKVVPMSTEPAEIVYDTDVTVDIGSEYDEDVYIEMFEEGE